jgi:hypothetical protein
MLDCDGFGGGYNFNLAKALKIIASLHLTLRIFSFGGIKPSLIEQMISIGYALTHKSVIISFYL